MKRFLQTLVLSLVTMIVPTAATAAYVQLADDVYCDGSTLYIGSKVTSLGALNLTPSVIYCYAQTPPSCMSNTFTGYGATLHVPTLAMVNYFSALYWYNFTNVYADAVEPDSVNLSNTSVQIEMGNQFNLTATVSPSNATPKTVAWFSTNTSIATVNEGTVTAVTPGECDIIAQCATAITVCHVTVKTELVTITLDQHEACLLPNHLLTLTATCTPVSTDLMVLTSDNSVAMPRLVNGKIQVLGLKEGTASITVGSVDGTANTDACLVTVYTNVGDVNSDGYVNIEDVTTTINCLLTDDTDTINITNADTNNDDKISIEDVTTLINYLLSGNWPWEPYHDWVDLGLPSGTLWATMNVGAYSPEDYGDYFAWGETEPKDYYDYNTYKWRDANSNTITKYCSDSSYGYNGFVDNKTELDPEDDAAYVNWGPSWRIPSWDQQLELLFNCTWKWTTHNGVNGYLATGPNGNTIFLPAAGHYWYDSLYGAESYGYYWSRVLYDTTGALNLYFDDLCPGGDLDEFSRFYGFTVRAVRASE